MNENDIYTVLGDAAGLYLEARGIQTVIDGIGTIVSGNIMTGLGKTVVGIGLGAGAAYVMEEDGGHERIATAIGNFGRRVKNAVPKVKVKKA